MSPDYRDFDVATAATVNAVQDYTMTSAERIFALCHAVRYLDRHRIPGAIVECGVWRGGSAMAIMRTLLDISDLERDIYLFDTFAGMTAPTSLDRNIDGVSADHLIAAEPDQHALIHAYATINEVRTNLATVGYPMERVHLIEGPVETTVPTSAPNEIALLRLDTDWYESTRHELDHLAHRISHLGVLLVDDYGHWYGARQAVDEFLDAFHRPVLLNRIDYTGRIAVIPSLPTYTPGHVYRQHPSS